MQTSKCHQNALQLDNTFTTVAVYPLQDHNTSDHPFQDHSATVPPFQDHAIHNVENLNNMLLDSFVTIGSIPDKYSIIFDLKIYSFVTKGSIPDKYSITFDLKIPPMLCRMCRFPIEAEEEIKTQLRLITTKISSHHK